MKIQDARPGAVIKERHITAHPRTVTAWENKLGKTVVVVQNKAGRTSRIQAKNISRYDLVTPGPA